MTGNSLRMLADLFNVASNIMILLIILRWVFSWGSPESLNPIVRFVSQVTEPILEPFRRFLPDSFSNVPYVAIRLTGVIAIIIIVSLNHFLGKTLVDLSTHLR